MWALLGTLADFPLRLSTMLATCRWAGDSGAGSGAGTQDRQLPPSAPGLRDALLAEAMTTFNAHRLHHGIQADRARDLLHIIVKRVQAEAIGVMLLFGSAGEILR